MIKNIITKNGKSYLQVSKNSWNLYLNKVSPSRSCNSSLDCGLKNKNLIRCNVCNKDMGSWTDSCVNIISNINLIRNVDILSEKNLTDQEFYEIEIDKNDDSHLI